MTDETLVELVGEVKELNTTTREFRFSLDSVKETLSRHRIALIVATIGLVLDLALSGLFVWQHEQQICRNDRSAAFFIAEKQKVAGQVKGLEEIKNAGTNQQLATDGFNKFIKASEDYLIAINHLKSC